MRGLCLVYLPARQMPFRPHVTEQCSPLGVSTGWRLVGVRNLRIGKYYRVRSGSGQRISDGVHLLFLLIVTKLISYQLISSIEITAIE